MMRMGQPNAFWRLAFVVCLAWFGLAFVPVPLHLDRASADRTLYSFQRGIPANIPNFVDVDAGCNWAGVGGQVFDEAGLPVTGLTVKISGVLEGRQILHYVYTGSLQSFGPGGFGLKLADQPVSSYSLKLQLLDAAGSPLSLPFFLRTYDNCQQNLLVVNLAPTNLDHSVFLPKVYR